MWRSDPPTVTLQEGREAKWCIGEKLGRTEIKEVSWGACRSPDSKWSGSLQETAAGGKERREWPGHDYRLGGEVGGIRWTRTEKWKQGSCRKNLFQMCWFHYFLLSVSLSYTHTHTNTLCHQDRFLSNISLFIEPVSKADPGKINLISIRKFSLST